ncbi:MAG: UDP-N-acetylmuramoyl-tripeptide--D-alanyl-D-alanine ligase [Nitrospinales bacterium]
MIEAEAKQVLKAAEGTLLFGSEEKKFRGVSIDSRTVQPGELYFCIKGDRFDGHDFIPEVLEKKAAGIVLSRKGKMSDALWRAAGSATPFVVAVRDTIAALQDYARFHRKRFAVRVVAVTGSNGKTGAKEMAAVISESRFKTAKTRGNFNNHIGVPLTLFDLDASHEVAIVEMGMSAAGEIRRLAEIAEPEIGIITNISEGHLMKLQTIKNVQAAKGELFEALDERGTAIVNADDPLVLELARNLRSKVVTFAIRNSADVRARDIRSRGNDGFDFTLSLFEKESPVFLPFLGRCNIYNALAAIAAGHSLGVDAEAMGEALGRSRLLPNRLEIERCQSMTLINDTYNANPRSMREALDVLSRYQTDGRRFFVIGDMLELGGRSAAAHIELGEEIAKRPVDFLVTIGELAGLSGQSAVKAGMASDRVTALGSRQEGIDYLKSVARPGDCLLFKGSRGSRMEKVVEGLRVAAAQ